MPAPPEGSLLVDELRDLVVNGISYEYEPPEEQVGWDGREGGWLLPVIDTYDLLADLDITEDGDLLDDLLQGMDQWQWVPRNPYSLTPAEALSYGWEQFRDFVTRQRRYTFFNQRDDDYATHGDPDRIPMAAVPQLITRAVVAGDLVTILPAGTAWWRGRPHPVDEFYSAAKDLGSPPGPVAKDNRMTPKGIGAFYGSDSLECAVAEVAAYAGSEQVITAAEFRLTRPAVILDLRKRLQTPSLFDPAERDRRPFVAFLRGFVHDVTRTAEPSDWQNLEYIPTQVVAEHLRFELPTPTGHLDGIMWASSQHPSGTTCVIFADNAQMANPADSGAESFLVVSPETLTRLHGPFQNLCQQPSLGDMSGR